MTQEPCPKCGITAPGVQCRMMDCGRLAAKEPQDRAPPWPKPPKPPWPIGADNGKITGWNAFFQGRARNNCPFPPIRKDLLADYEEGWDAAGASIEPDQRTPRSDDPFVPPYVQDDSTLAGRLNAMAIDLRDTEDLAWFYQVAKPGSRTRLAIAADLEAAAAGLAAAAGWQPIETAPQDGTKVDLWTEEGRLCDCYFYAPWKRWARDEGHPVVTVVMRGLKPTHWMKLVTP